MKEIKTWGGRSNFTYSGSVGSGTKIICKGGYYFKFSSEEYKKLLEYFSGKTVNVGTSRTDPPGGSLGHWIDKNFNKKGTTSYIGAILLEEGYAVRTVNKAEIKFK